MEKRILRFKTLYNSKGHTFTITASLKEFTLNITYIIKYSEKSGYVNVIQIDHQYVDEKKFMENWRSICERCDSIAERLSGWKRVTRTLNQLGFMEVEENE